MARPESSSSPLLWIGGAILAAGAVVIGGFWVYAITTAKDMPLLLAGGPPRRTSRVGRPACRRDTRQSHPQETRELHGGRQLIVTTTDAIPGATIVETLGLVRGSTVRARHIGRDIMAGLRNIVGGEVDEYTKLLAEAREESLQRMIDNAEGMGGNAIVCVRFITAGVAQGAAEIVAYGTAVKIA